MPASGVRLPALVATSLLLGGCASLTGDAGFADVAKATQARLGHQVQWSRNGEMAGDAARRVQALLAKPLGVEDAVQLALLNNRGLQARFAELGITEAEVVQASSLPNPGFSFGRTRQGDEREIERGFHLNVARLIALPIVARMEQQRLAQTRGESAMAVLTLAADTRKAWVDAVAAIESVTYMRQVMQAAAASAELARRMQAAGNFNKLARAREQSFYADAALGLARAEQRQRATRERLTRLLGAWGEQTTFELPDRLPDLPANVSDQPDIERTAMRQRMDVEAARMTMARTARNLGLTKATRFVNVFELGLMRNGSNEAPRQTGWEVGFEIPLFDWGGARVARAEGIYMQAAHRAAETAVNARSEVREAYGNYRSAYDMARHQRDEIVPLKKRIAEEQLLRYNGMLIGVFELLADARMQITSVNNCIDSLREFWLASADLDMALIGKAAIPMAAGAAPGSGAEAPAAAH